MLHSLLRSAGGEYNNRKCSRAETFCCNSARHARNASAEQEAEITCCWKLCPSWTCEILQNWTVNKHHIFAIKMDYLVCLGLAVVLRREREKCTKLYLITLGGIFCQNQHFGIWCVNTTMGQERDTGTWLEVFLFFSQNLCQYYNTVHSPSSPSVPFNHHQHQQILKDLRELAIKQVASQSSCT